MKIEDDTIQEGNPNIYLIKSLLTEIHVEWEESYRMSSCAVVKRSKLLKKYYCCKPSMYELNQLLRVNNVKELCKLGKYIMFKVVHSELTPICETFKQPLPSFHSPHLCIIVPLCENTLFYFSLFIFELTVHFWQKFYHNYICIIWLLCVVRCMSWAIKKIWIVRVDKLHKGILC